MTSVIEHWAAQKLGRGTIFSSNIVYLNTYLGCTYATFVVDERNGYIAKLGEAVDIEAFLSTPDYISSSLDGGCAGQEDAQENAEKAIGYIADQAMMLLANMPDFDRSDYKATVEAHVAALQLYREYLRGRGCGEDDEDGAGEESPNPNLIEEAQAAGIAIEYDEVSGNNGDNFEQYEPGCECGAPHPCSDQSACDICGGPHGCCGCPGDVEEREEGKEEQDYV